MLLAHSAISFSHVRRDANKAADLLANADVDGELAQWWGHLEKFEAEYWAHHCRQMAAHDLEEGTQMACPNSTVARGDRRH